MYIIKHRNWFFALTGVLVVASLIALLTFGLRLSIDFTGGTLVTATYSETRAPATELDAALRQAGFDNFSLREAGERDVMLRTGSIDSGERETLADTFSIDGQYPVTISQLSEIGPTIGAELRKKAVLSIALVMLCILFFIAFAFRKVSQPVSSWIYGLVALVTLLHDVIVPVGFFAILGHFHGAVIDTLFVTAILTVLGFSVHDTIVVFDRTRENLRLNHEKGRKEDFAETAGRSLSQTFTRSVNTSLTVIITLLILYFIGPASTKDFALTLLVGIIAGTYSSIFLATPLLVTIEKKYGKRT
ncbi:protein translocase subunit SecF [Candidatus Parcubacteria bacterium]|nr:MAG: protein translocase subunit SecF [Candidatus Parcubacteria bacterium]